MRFFIILKTKNKIKTHYVLLQFLEIKNQQVSNLKLHNSYILLIGGSEILVEKVLS